MKKFTWVVLVTTASLFINQLKAQGWVAKDSNTIVAYNSALNVIPIKIGIGTNAPTAQLHNVGSVRLEGLSRHDTYSKVLVIDSKGYLSYREISSLGNSGGWLLAGNAGTNPSTNFLGTTDNQRLVFRTNNTEKVTILQNGNTGIGISTPFKPLHVYSSIEDNNTYLSGSSPSIYFSLTPTYPAGPPYNSPISRFGLATRKGAFVSTSAIGDFILQNITAGGNLILGADVDPGNNGIERMRITATGNVGINTITPTAKLDVNGSVRFENLPTGSGYYLVVDASGNVKKSANQSAARSRMDNESDELKALREEVDLLKAEVSELKQKVNNTQSLHSSIEQNNLIEINPNPSQGQVIIKSFVPASVRKAELMINDINGKPLKRIVLSNTGVNTVTYNTQNGSGTFLTSLVFDGSEAYTKKFVVIK